jgi:hypothetical protein
LKNNQLNKLLLRLGLENTVFFRNKDNNAYDFDFHIDVKNKLETIQPEAIYVFDKQPFILFFDLTKNEDLVRENEIHKKVWSFDNSPVIFIIKKSEIQVFNALNYIKDKDGNNGKLEELNLADNEIDSKFSFWNLQSGETWKWFQNDYLENTKKRETRKRVNERLFQNIKEVRHYLTKDSINRLDDKQANSLILRLIFIRYLIDRGIKIDESFIFGITTNDKRKSFSELIKQPKRLNQLFENLNDKFNGVLFIESDIQLNQIQSDFLANVFKGELQEQGSLFEGYFFEIFDFSIIPVEVISGIYESLIDEETRELNSAVYTPSFLVDYILNDTVEDFLNKSQSSECGIFEVAVGSGIFLVQSLRRMIEKEIELNGKEDKEAFSNKIRDIVKNNLFGIDINREALKVTCFSIYIALLDYQEPKDVEKYPFPNLLDENLFEANFFDITHKFNEVVKLNKPKFILGNPPWKNGSKDKIHIQYLKENNLLNIVSDFQLAQSFVLRTKDFKDSFPICSLIITGKSFYNNNANNFKEKFLRDFSLNKILDLSPVRSWIFSNAKNPAMIINFQAIDGEESTGENIVNYESLKSNVFFKNFKILTIEKFDKKYILQKYFSKYSWMFKNALYGNALDFALLSRIKESNENTINDFITNNNMLCGNGIKKGTPKSHFDKLIGLPVIETSQIKMFYSPVTEHLHRLVKEDVYLEAGRTPELFVGKKILLSKRTKNETYLNISLIENNCVFRDSANSITQNSNENSENIEFLYSLLISNLYTYYQFLTSSSWGVYYPEIHKAEYISFPVNEPSKEIKEQLIDLVNQYLKPYKEFYKKFNIGLPQKNDLILGQINSIINNLYGIKKHEEDLIDYVLDVSRYQFQESKQSLFTRKVDSDEEFLKNYIDIYIHEFEKIYDDEFMQIEIYSLNHFIALNFVFLDSKPEKSIVYSNNKNEKEVLKRLANNLSVEQITNTYDTSKNLFIQKDIKGFESNSFYIIKPNEYKCWHKAMAWYDVAEFKEAIQKAELNRLNNQTAND